MASSAVSASALASSAVGTISAAARTSVISIEAGRLRPPSSAFSRWCSGQVEKTRMVAQSKDGKNGRSTTMQPRPSSTSSSQPATSFSRVPTPKNRRDGVVAKAQSFSPWPPTSMPVSLS